MLWRYRVFRGALQRFYKASVRVLMSSVDAEPSEPQHPLVQEYSLNHNMKPLKNYIYIYIYII